jgi:Tfp pilus assembly protein PilV
VNPVIDEHPLMANPKQPIGPMYPSIRRKPKRRGFALVITLSLMVLLTILAVGLLSLSAISLRSTSTADAQAQAYANARMAVMMALGQLQKNAGDDRRITADASISASAGQPGLVGVYNSWSHNFISQPDKSITSSQYTNQKNTAFRTWLASSPDQDALATRDWSDTAPDSEWVKLFSVEQNGFDLSAPPIETETGAVAWVVSQENTKAKVNVAGPDEADDLPTNAVLQAQLRPSLRSADYLKHPDEGWNLRAGKVISANQVGLDSQLAASKDIPMAGKSYTVHSQGLLTDAVYGGLKADLNLGFELGDGQFAQSSWDGLANPFRGTKAKAGFAVPGSFRGQMPLFRPLSNTDNPIVTAVVPYDVATVAERFYGAGVPTFDHLRSYYRVAHHLYGNTNSPTVAERPLDHVAVTLTATTGTKPAPSRAPRGQKSQTSIKPVLNRMVYLLSAGLDSGFHPQLVMTPVISLWNPYNTALEIEGAVAYPWIDVPFHITWNFNPKRVTYDTSCAMSQIMGKQFQAQNHGRQINPYFLCEISASGGGGVGQPIRFEPGEVRVFAPAAQTPVPFVRDSLLAAKTIRMRPVDNVNQFSTKGGLVVPMKAGGQGFDYTMQNGDTAQVTVRESNAGAYHYFMTLEDATRLKTDIPESAQGGQATGDVQMLNFVSTANSVQSTVESFSALRTGGVPFGVLESYHRTAGDNVGGQSVADLVYTTNPRNPSITHLLTTNPSSWKAAPHYQTTLRATTSFQGAIQTSGDGRNSFWGNSHTPAGQTRLPFFDLPRQPMLSLANFQNADLGSSPYGPAFQFANSWASAWLGRNRAAMRTTAPNVQAPVPVYDTAFLTNEALWDGFFFSGAAPRLSPGSRPNLATAWDNPVAQESRSTKTVLQNFVNDPLNEPLGNPRMRLYRNGQTDDELVQELTSAAGCVKIAGHLMVDGAFNVNSTDEDAWVALLSGGRGAEFETDGGNGGSSTEAAFPRFRSPTGSKGGIWNGYRALDDGEIRTLARNIVDQVRRRGPFLSLAEFVNRRIETTDLGRSGAIQSAIDAAGFNSGSRQTSFATTSYPNDAKGHIVNDTGVGIPGYLSQADVLQPLAPVITCRSDTFTIRGYGEAKDGNGEVTARAWCEAVVQRVPDFVDPEDKAYSAIADLSLVNQTFGRRFEIVSFRQIPRPEIHLQ